MGEEETVNIDGSFGGMLLQRGEKKLPGKVESGEFFLR